jgi:hypothetical protein
MSLLVRVELPTYSHSFQVFVPSTGTVNDIKREIERACTGNPRVHGQRLIWRGRFLDDDEKVPDIWKVRRPLGVLLPHIGAYDDTIFGWIVSERRSHCASFGSSIGLGQRTSKRG